MKKFTIPCVFGSKKSPFDVYIGNDFHSNYHPLHYQCAWLEKERGGVIPVDVMGSFSKLKTLAKENEVAFDELCVYALDEAQKNKGKGE